MIVPPAPRHPFNWFLPPDGTVFYANNNGDNDTVPINITAAVTPGLANINCVMWWEDHDNYSLNYTNTSFKQP